MRATLRIRSIWLPLATLGLLAIQLIQPAPTWKGLLTAFAGLWLIGYLWAKQNEITNLRIIVKGKAVGMPADRMRKELILV